MTWYLPVPLRTFMVISLYSGPIAAVAAIVRELLNICHVKSMSVNTISMTSVPAVLWWAETVISRMCTFGDFFQTSYTSEFRQQNVCLYVWINYSQNINFGKLTSRYYRIVIMNPHTEAKIPKPKHLYRRINFHSMKYQICHICMTITFLS